MAPRNGAPLPVTNALNAVSGPPRATSSTFSARMPATAAVGTCRISGSTMTSFDSGCGRHLFGIGNEHHDAPSERTLRVQVADDIAVRGQGSKEPGLDRVARRPHSTDVNG